MKLPIEVKVFGIHTEEKSFIDSNEFCNHINNVCHKYAPFNKIKLIKWEDSFAIMIIGDIIVAKVVSVYGENVTKFVNIHDELEDFIIHYNFAVSCEREF